MEIKYKKDFEVNPNCFFPKPKVDSTVLHFSLKESFYQLKNVKNLETVTRIFLIKEEK